MLRLMYVYGLQVRRFVNLTVLILHLRKRFLEQTLSYANGLRYRRMKNCRSDIRECRTEQISRKASRGGSLERNVGAN